MPTRFFFCCFFQIQLFRKTSFRNTVSVSNSLDPDQARRLAGPDLGPNCLQKSTLVGKVLIHGVSMNNCGNG